jgi:hypothetical protein
MPGFDGIPGGAENLMMRKRCKSHLKNNSTCQIMPPC